MQYVVHCTFSLLDARSSDPTCTWKTPWSFHYPLSHNYLPSGSKVTRYPVILSPEVDVSSRNSVIPLTLLCAFPWREREHHDIGDRFVEIAAIINDEWEGIGWNSRGESAGRTRGRERDREVGVRVEGWRQLNTRETSRGEELVLLEMQPAPVAEQTPFSPLLTPFLSPKQALQETQAVARKGCCFPRRILFIFFVLFMLPVPPILQSVASNVCHPSKPFSFSLLRVGGWDARAERWISFDLDVLQQGFVFELDW